MNTQQQVLRLRSAELAVDLIRAGVVTSSNFTSQAEEILGFLSATKDEPQPSEPTFDPEETLHDVAKKVQEGVSMWLGMVDKYLGEKSKTRK